MSPDPENRTLAVLSTPTPSRRTVLTGAAWSVPVIAAASMAPAAAAASNAPVLTFDKTTYIGVACGTITGARVTVTAGGTPVPNATVTTILSGRYAFIDGSSKNVQATDVNGKVDLPTITIPTGGGPGTATASASGSTTATSLSAPVVGAATSALFTASSPSAPASTDSWAAHTPSTAVPIGGYGFYLDGTDVWYGDNKVLTNVTRAVANSSNGADYVTYVQGGQAKGASFASWSPAAPGFTESWATSTPATAVPLGGYGFFRDGTDVWYRDNKVLTNVGHVIANSGNGCDYVTYVQGGQAKSAVFSPSAPATALLVESWSAHTPATAVPIGGYGFFLDGTDVWYRDNKVLTNVTRAVANSSDSTDYVTYMQGGKAKGSAFSASTPAMPTSTDTWGTYTPATAVPLDGYGFYLDGTDLWYRDNKIFTNITRATANSGNGSNYVTHIQANC